MASVKDIGFNMITVAYPAEPKYTVIGADSQVVQVQVQPGEAVKCEPGTMMHMDPRFKSDVELQPMCGCKSACAGESCVKVTYTNSGDTPGYLGLTPNFPAKVVPLILAQGQRLRVKPKGYMAEIGDVDIGMNLDCCSKTCCCGGIGCIQQSLTGKSPNLNVAFLAAGGTVMEKNLVDGEEIIVDMQSLVAWDSTVTYDLRLAGGSLTMCCAGEGMFVNVMKGPGRVVIQSMSFEKFCKAVAPPPGAGAAGAGAGAAGAAAGGGGGATETEEEMTR